MNLRIVTRHLRLLPAVLIAGTVLLVLKGVGLVHDHTEQPRHHQRVARQTIVEHSDGRLHARVVHRA